MIQWYVITFLLLLLLFVYRFYPDFLITIIDNRGIIPEKWWLTKSDDIITADKFQLTNFPLDYANEIDTLMINLDSAVKRWEIVKSHLNEINLAPIPLSAVDGISSPSESEIYKKYGYDRLKCMKKNNHTNHIHLACYLSHINALKAALTSSKNWILICEDDVEFNANKIFVKNALNTIVNDLNHDKMDIIWLNTNHCPPPGSTEAYIVTKNGARKLLDALTPGSDFTNNWTRRTCLYDWVLYDLIKGNPEFNTTCIKITKQNNLTESQIG